MIPLRIPCSRPYDVLVGDGLLDRADELLHTAVPRARRALVVTDSNVAALHLPRTLASLRAAGLDASEFVFPAGESSKNERTLFDILGACAAAGLTRTDVVVALGGGVVGDIAGLAASLWLRGIAVVQIPTTLLAAVDSSVGGKTAIDIDAGKNLVGAFHQPSLVLCDPALLATLPAEVFADGCAEVIKYAFIGAAELRA
ncbi:MAG: 3-dehydroquinate synthase, partial [Kiritimatiellae bacterium]|nr:3-dehydroquinate synthase [Kiritimatiellia bacterium]